MDLDPIIVKLPRDLDDRNCLLKVATPSGKLHQSWLLEDGKIIGYEDVPDNWPAGAIMVWHSIQDYIENIKEVDWINVREYILISTQLLEQHGFPFSEEEDEEDYYTEF